MTDAITAPSSAAFSGASMSRWTEERLDILRRMHVAGRSYTQIAAALGTSRSAVAGIASRLGLPAREACKRVPIVEPVPVVEVPPRPPRLTLFDLTSSMCRWPIGTPRHRASNFAACRSRRASRGCGAGIANCTASWPSW